MYVLEGPLRSELFLVSRNIALRMFSLKVSHVPLIPNINIDNCGLVWSKLKKIGFNPNKILSDDFFYEIHLRSSLVIKTQLQRSSANRIRVPNDSETLCRYMRRYLATISNTAASLAKPTPGYLLTPMPGIPNL